MVLFLNASLRGLYPQSLSALKFQLGQPGRGAQPDPASTDTQPWGLLGASELFPDQEKSPVPRSQSSQAPCRSRSPPDPDLWATPMPSPASRPLPWLGHSQLLVGTSWPLFGTASVACPRSPSVPRPWDAPFSSLSARRALACLSPSCTPAAPHVLSI